MRTLDENKVTEGDSAGPKSALVNAEVHDYACKHPSLCPYKNRTSLFLLSHSQSCYLSAVLLPGLRTVQRSGDQVSPAVSVEDQGLAAGKDPTSKTDLGSAEGGEAVVGGEARAGETLREECREGLGGKLTGWTAETWVTS